MPILKEASRFENFLRKKGLLEIEGPTKREMTDRMLEVDRFCYHIRPSYRIVVGNGAKYYPKTSMIIHYYRIFLNDEFLGRYQERHDDGDLVKQSFEGAIPGYDFSSDGGHSRLRRIVWLVYLPISLERKDEFPSIIFPWNWDFKSFKI